MEVYVALFDYEKEREDVLSFKKGDKFEIASKADKKWWAAYAQGTREYGYIPSKYLEQHVDSSEGAEAQKKMETPEGANKKSAMAELMKKVPRTPVSSGSQKDEDEGSKKEEGVVIIKPLSEMVRIPDDCVQIEPKKLANPHVESRQHKDLNREIRITNARGGAQNLGQPELMKVMRRRKPDADGNLGSIKPSSQNKTRASSPGGELGEKMARRTQLMEQYEKDQQEEEDKPDFLKVALKKTQQC